MNDTVTLLTRRADLAPASADRDARTVEVIWSTGAPVRRRDMAGQYIERLSLDPEAVDLSRLQGASVLDAHRQSAVRDVLGSVQSASVDGQRGTALIRFSARPEVEPLWQDVLSGILRHVSVGYSVEEWAESTESGARVLTAVRWTPHEISLVPTPADPGARIRMETQMTDTTITPAPPEAQTRAAINTEIRSIARIAGLDQSWIDGQIDAAADADTARHAAFDALAARSAPTIRTEQVRIEMGESQDDPALRARQMGEALYARINPRHELSEPARRYAYATPVDMAKELLIVGNIFGIAAHSAAEGDPIELATTGVFKLPKATAAVLTVGARVAWDNTAKNINVPGAGRFPVGVATEAAGNGTTSIAVRLDGVATVAA